MYVQRLATTIHTEYIANEMHTITPCIQLHHNKIISHVANYIIAMHNSFLHSGSFNSYRCNFSGCWVLLWKGYLLVLGSLLSGCSLSSMDIVQWLKIVTVNILS